MALVPPFHSENEVHCGVVWRLRRTTTWTLRRTGQDGDVNAARSSSSSGTQLTLKPAHTKISTYRYNSLNQLTWQETPDGGITEFFYDPAGRLVFSQNARQRPAGKYSYTLYDQQGRIIETGAFVPASWPFPLLPPGQHPQQILQSSSTQADVIEDLVHGKPREDVVATIYDHPLLNLGSFEGLSPQQNLRKRVSAILYAPVVAQSNTITSYYSYATHFSYDAAGNVSSLVHDNPYMDYMGQRFKRIDYDYDLLSGKVNMLSYNRGLADQIYHRYRYDADNRIIKAESSRDGLGWDRDAAYEYYKHGPLAQISIGDLQVQAMQYAYTIQGWLKAVNGDVLNPGEDMGKNGENGGLFPSDVMSHALDYYAGDYKPIGSTPVMHTLAGNGISRSLYNGNIARQTTGMAGMTTLQRDYEYDQLNRIKQTVYASMDHITHAVSSLGNAFKNTYGYDPDGNITTLTRHDGSGSLLDNFTYTYYDPAAHNRLSSVADAASGSTGSDLQPGQAAGNYKYDPSGNLTMDVQEGIKHISWNSYGKVTSLTKGTAEDDTMELFFSYDGAGNRVRKDYIRPGETPGVQERVSDIYVRDAAGNILAVYKSHSGIDGGSLIEWINETIYDQDGGWISPQGWGLASFLAEQFGSNGSFTAPLLDYAVGNSSAWVQEQTGLGTGFYLAHSAGLLLQAAAEPKLGDYLDPLQTYFGGQAGALVLSGSNGPELLSGLWNEGSGRITEIKASFLSLYAAHPPTADSLLDMLNLSYDPGDPFDKRADVLTGYTVHYPAATLQAYAALQDSMDAGALRNFRSALLGSPPIKKWVLDRQQEALAAKLQRVLVKQDSVAVQDSVIAFFTQWLPDYDEDWLPHHATPSDQLNIVYESDRPGFLVAFLDEFGIAPVNAVLKGIKGLTGTAYAKGVGTAVLTGTLNPSYNPPEVNTPDPDNLLGESMYLAEHHLYGSSRLGIKHYDSTQYQAIYEQGEEALTVTTLNARRPWYSFSQSDWIKKDKASEFTGATYNLSLDTLRERRWIGRKEYELTDHLGNVVVTVLDRKTGYGNSSGSYIGFNADVASITDYYPFGMPIAERSLINGRDFRFGWNAHEKVNEIAGIGNHTTAEFGEFDTRIGRRWNRDLKSELMPNESPYAVNHGNPITYKDPKGDFGFIGAAIGAVAGAVIEYGSQAASNIIQGKSLKDALWNEIDFVDVGVSAAEGALAGTTGGASLIVTRVTAGAVRASVDYTKKDGLKYIGGKDEKRKSTKDFLIDAGSELIGGAVGAGFDKAGSKEFVRKAPRSLFKGGVKKAVQALEDEVIMGTVESAVPTIIDGAVRGEIEVELPIPLGYEDHKTGEIVPFNTSSQTQEK